MSNITDRARQLLLRPIIPRKCCSAGCVMLLIVLEDRVRIWRCESCDRQISVDILPSTGQGLLF